MSMGFSLSVVVEERRFEERTPARAVAYPNGVQVVVGSNPTVPTIFSQ